MDEAIKENYQKLIEQEVNNLQSYINDLRTGMLFRSHEVFARWGCMLYQLLSEVELTIPDIPLDEPDVLEIMSGMVELEGHPYLPKGSIFFLGSIWGLPGVGQECCVRALKETGAVHSFLELVWATKKAMAYRQTEGNVSFDIACADALRGYVLTYLLLYYPVEWNRKYCAYMHPVCMRGEGDEEEEQKYPHGFCPDLPPETAFDENGEEVKFPYAEEDSEYAYESLGQRYDRQLEEYETWIIATGRYKLSEEERLYKHYWEDVLMLLPDEDHNHNGHHMFLFPWLLRSRSSKGCRNSPKDVSEIEAKAALCNVKKKLREGGVIAALEYSLMLLPDEDHNHQRHYRFLLPWLLRGSSYKDLDSPKDVSEIEAEAALCKVENKLREEGAVAAVEYSERVLKGTYSDFWTWLEEEEIYREDAQLERIACHCPSTIVYRQKLEFLEIAKKSGIVRETLKPQFCAEKPVQTYDARRRMVSLQTEKRKTSYFLDLKAYCASFTKYSVDTKSGKLFDGCTQEGMEVYLRNISNRDLIRAFVLYHPAQREHIFKSLSFRLMVMLLEDFKYLTTQDPDFSLVECEKSLEAIETIVENQKKIGR